MFLSLQTLSGFGEGGNQKEIQLGVRSYAIVDVFCLKDNVIPIDYTSFLGEFGGFQISKKNITDSWMDGKRPVGGAKPRWVL